MTTNTDVERLIAEAEDRLQFADFGPWNEYDPGEEDVVRNVHGLPVAFFVSEENRRFIAWARNNIPALIAALRAMQADMAVLEANKNAAHHWRRENLARAEAAEANVANLKEQVEAMRGAIGILEDALQEAGDDYPGSRMQEWCQQQVSLARAALTTEKTNG